MRWLKSFGLFWWDFVIGDDWIVAAAVVAGLALTALLTHVAGVNAWWLLPILAVGLIPLSIWRLQGRTSASHEPSSRIASRMPLTGA